MLEVSGWTNFGWAGRSRGWGRFASSLSWGMPKRAEHEPLGGNALDGSGSSSTRKQR